MYIPDGVGHSVLAETAGVVNCPCRRLGCDVRISAEGPTRRSWRLFHDGILQPEEITYQAVWQARRFEDVLVETVMAMSLRLHSEPEKPSAFPPGPCTCNTCA